MRRRTARAQGGFSLLEVIVAMSIMAISLGALYQSGGGALRGALEAGARTRATALALALLDGQWSVPPTGLQDGGNIGGMTWHLVTTPFQPGPAMGEKGWALHRIEVSVSWDEGRRNLKLASLLPERRSSPGSGQQAGH